MIIDRYLLREVATPFLAISIALITLYVTFSLTRYLTDATEGLLAANAVFRLTLLRAVIALEMLLPVALYIGLLVTLGRFYSDWEVTAMRASGISERRIILPVMGLAVVIGLGIASLSFWARPWAYNALYEFEAQAEAFNDLAELHAGQFHYDAKRHRVVFMSRRTSRRDLAGLFVRTSDGDDIQVLTATSGNFVAYARPDAHRLDVHDARIFRIGTGKYNLTGSFDEFTLWLPTVIPDPVGYKPKRMSNSELAASPAPDAHAELQWRESTAVSAVLLALLAVPLSRTRPRRGRYSKILIAVVIFALYYNLLGVARTGVEQEATRTIWWAPALLAVVVAIAFFTGRRPA
ncbi:MAG: LPS export ABC transporter permease LptF [Pseudomonadales bacterium]|jgi:lipopolysaccharide export system permease protein